MKLRISQLSKQAGFTILEIMIVVGVLAVVASLALPSYVRSRQIAQNTQTLGDLRVFSDQLATFNVEARTWPDDTLPGRFPNKVGGVDDFSLAQAIKMEDWFRGPAIGGEYDWDMDVNGVAAAVAIANPTADVLQLTKLDEKLDDGNLSTGAFRQVYSGLIYVLQEDN